MPRVVQAALADRLRDRIGEGGPLPFATWMEACLYDPAGGFYAQAEHPAGAQASHHFATSPTLHPFFAQAVAAEVADAWQRSGRPTAWTVTEFGAGTGALARDATAWLRDRKVPVAWTAVDTGPAGEAAPGVTWSPTAPAAFDMAVANEFLDALPFDLHEWRGKADGWQRVGVGLGKDGDGFAWALLGPSRIALPPGAKAGERRVAMPGASVWLDAVARAGARSAILSDYGAEGPATSVRAYRGQDHADPLDEPGTVDITADVDFLQLAALAGRHGFAARGETQEAFLLRHGVLDALNATDRSTVEGASSYLRLRQLLLPTGLGAAFKVLRLDREPTGSAPDPQDAKPASGSRDPPPQRRGAKRDEAPDPSRSSR